MATTDLEHLLLQGQQLCKDTDNYLPVSKIHKSLRQLCRNADHAPKQMPGSSDEQHAKEFLANRGLDLANYSNVLKKLFICRDNVVMPCESKPVMDYSSSVESLMGRHIEDYISNLEATDPNKEVDSCLNDVPTGWKNIKNSVVYNEFASDSYDLSFCFQNLPTSKNTHFTINPSLSGLNGSSDNFIFVTDIQNYINAKEKGNSDKELIEYFLETIHKDNTNSTVTHIWNVVKYMYDINPQNPTSNGSYNERFSEENQIKLVKNAKKYLENKYQSFLIKETKHLDVSSNDMAAVISCYVFMNTGRPATQQNDFYVDEQSIWPLLYFSLRCGRLDIANYFIKQSGLALDDLLNVFVYLKDANFRERSASNIGVTLNKYYRTLPVYDNAFRKTIFSLLGMVEANIEKKAVAKTIEDKLWMLLVEHFASKYMEDTNGLDYSSLQRYILDNSKLYKEQPHIYFELLFLIGQFESAIDFLYRNVTYSNHAVHIAIVLNEKHLLATSKYLQAPFLSNENVDIKFVRLNYIRLILLFCNGFQSNYPHYATYYYYFLKNIKSPMLTENLFYKCVADLATSFDGNMCDWMFGCLIDNTIENSILQNTFSLDTVTTIANKTLELSLETNKPEVAYKLYSLTSNKAAYGVLNNILSNTIYNFDIFGQTKNDEKHNNGNKTFYDRLYLYSEELKQKESSFLETAGPVMSFHVLRSMYLFFYYSSKHKFLSAIEQASNTDLVPLAGEDTKHCLTNCTKYGDIIQRNIHHFIKSLVSVLCAEHIKIAKHQCGSLEDDLLIEEENSDVFDQSYDIGWTKQRIQKTIRVIYLFTAQLPVNIALDAVEYISTNSFKMQLE